MIGYWLDEAQWGKGYMSEAVCAVLDYGFNKLGLTLISANCYPQNKRSQHCFGGKWGLHTKAFSIKPKLAMMTKYMIICVIT